MAIGSNDEAKARAAMQVLEEFYEPFNQQDGFTPLVMAVARVKLSSVR